MTDLSPILENDLLLKESDVNEISNNLVTNWRSAIEEACNETTISYGSFSASDDIAFKKIHLKRWVRIYQKDIIVITDGNDLAPTAVKDDDDAENKTVNVKAMWFWWVLPSKKFS